MVLPRKCSFACIFVAFWPIEEYPYRLLFIYIRDECDGRQKEENYLFFPASVTQVWRYILT